MADRAASPADEGRRPPEPKKKRTRTRTGCLNCRRMKRKCDEARPTCGRCARRREACERGIKITFRTENSQTILEDHPSMRKARRPPLRHKFEVLNITNDVIRNYLLPLGLNDYDFEPGFEPNDDGTPACDDDGGSLEVADSPMPYSTSTAWHTVSVAEPATAKRTFWCGPPDGVPVTGFRSVLTPSTRREDDASEEGTRPAGDGMDFQASPSSGSKVPADSAVANLLYLSQRGAGSAAQSHPAPSVSSMPISSLTLDPMMDAPFEFMDQMITPEGSYDAGIFLPGSAYHELHSTLRNHLIQEVRSNGPTRPASPWSGQNSRRRSVGSGDEPKAAEETPEPAGDVSGHEPPFLVVEECALWKNWIDEISPWLDKFDNQRHFQLSLLTMARSHDHLRYSILALSARQLELKDSSLPTDRSLALYHEAINLLLPQLSTRTTAVIASCVVLCVLEMASCSPKAWQRHLDGCASLMEAVGINGFVGGVEQALFWCFARMDVCGGLISSVKTLIPVSHWASKIDLDADVSLFLSNLALDTWANYAVYLCAQVLDLLAPLAKANPGGLFFDGPRNDVRYRVRWMKLWRYVEDWPSRRPPEMQSIMSIPSSDKDPFPRILYSNSAAISGNQLYHTASLLMLQNKPASLKMSPRPRSALWHAKQICGISIANHNHAAWTNSLQPLWIAGRCMSHPAEHRAILGLLDKIEKESGWSTKWRADDWKEFWGDLEDGWYPSHITQSNRQKHHSR
ncbi:hypothetical protein FALCPG4_005632 [Fusarium falciforme]